MKKLLAMFVIFTNKKQLLTSQLSFDIIYFQVGKAMTNLEKLIKVINSCETNAQLAVAYRYYMRAAKLEITSHNMILAVFNTYYMDRSKKINAPVVERQTRQSQELVPHGVRVRISLGVPKFGAVAHQGERYTCNVEAVGSIPSSSTKFDMYLSKGVTLP